MQHYTKIPYWENKKRLALIKRFRSYVSTYYGNSRYSWQAEGQIEEEEAQQARTEINLILHDAHKSIICAGVPTMVQYTPPPVIGGYIQNIDVIQNIFILHQFQIGSDGVFDIVDRSIGIYESDQTASLRRTINPFWWIGKLFTWIVGLPFNFLGSIGFDKKKAEESFTGRLVKGFLYLIMVSAALLTILDLLDLLDKMKELFK